jgi:hypothetical protein
VSKKQRAWRIEDLPDQPVQELGPDEARKAAGGVILVKVLEPLTTLTVPGLTFPTYSDGDNGDGRTSRS